DILDSVRRRRSATNAGQTERLTGLRPPSLHTAVADRARATRIIAHRHVGPAHAGVGRGAGRVRGDPGAIGADAVSLHRVAAVAGDGHRAFVGRRGEAGAD